MFGRFAFLRQKINKEERSKVEIMKRNKLYGTTFCGNEASDYAKEQGYLDYATFVKSFDAVMSNDIIQKTWEIIGYWEQENGIIDNSEEIEELEEQLEELKEEQEQSYNQDIFQYFIVSDQGAEMIKQYTDDPLFYNENLDMYVWGVTHCGTSWDYVLTDVKLNCGQEAFE